ncbi:MAG: membrane dipeptidase [Oscillospiraceae bacterium]|nr:membrane dipeptidase [Oscillospiraceae bacterium]
MSFPVFDLHCDTALVLAQRDIDLASNDAHIDLLRASELPGYCQCFACFTTPFMEQWGEGSPRQVFQAEMDAITRELNRNNSIIRQVFTAEDIQTNLGSGIMSAILTIEGPAGFGFDPAALEDLYRTGFRITTLGWNEDNALTGSHVTGGGLTDLGREYVREAQRLGMLIDVSHISDRGFYDIMDITQAPVIASHSNSRSVCDVSRNLTDDMFIQICKTGGVAGFNQCAPFVGVSPGVEESCKHFLHFLELDPDGKHIALGGDLDGCDQLPIGFDGVQDYPALAAALMNRGIDQTLAKDIFWNNAFRVFKTCR